MRNRVDAPDRPVVARLGGAGLVVMVFANLVWDPALTLLGVSTFGIAEEDEALVRALLRVHPGLWLGAKLVFVGLGTGVVYHLGIHRDPTTAWIPWLVAALGLLGPLDGDDIVTGRGTAALGRVIRGSTFHLFAMANGKVDFFNDTGGYGFISTDDGDLDDDEDVFFHMEDVGGPDLEEGTEVEFDIESSPKGPRAANVVRQ